MSQESTSARLLFEPKETSGEPQLRYTHLDWKAGTDYSVPCAKVGEELRLKTAEGKGLCLLLRKEGLAS
jgi:hypothetical protein